MNIGDAIGSATERSLLFVGPSGVLAQANNDLGMVPLAGPPGEFVIPSVANDNPLRNSFRSGRRQIDRAWAPTTPSRSWIAALWFTLPPTPLASACVAQFTSWHAV